MIDLQRPLSPTLASLLVRQFTPEFFKGLESVRLDGPGDQLAMERFLAGLRDNRLDLRSDLGGEDFCEVVIGYLEALLDPGKDVLQKSGIEQTASSATTVWARMTDIQRTVLWREAAELHRVIESLAMWDGPDRS